jgi:hypothetical protein
MFLGVARIRVAGRGIGACFTEVTIMRFFEESQFSESMMTLDFEEDRSCPECGAPMVEFDRLTEDGAVFIWYACTQANCTGQWLRKTAPRMCGV